MLLSAGWDGIMNLYKIDEVEEDDALRQTIPQNQKADIQCARFVSDESIASMSFRLETGIRTISISGDLSHDSFGTFAFDRLVPLIRDLVDLINTGQNEVSVVAIHGEYVLFFNSREKANLETVMCMLCRGCSRKMGKNGLSAIP